MARFIIETKQVIHRKYFVDANSIEEAEEMVLNEEVEFYDHDEGDLEIEYSEEE